MKLTWQFVMLFSLIGPSQLAAAEDEPNQDLLEKLASPVPAERVEAFEQARSATQETQRELLQVIRAAEGHAPQRWVSLPMQPLYGEGTATVRWRYEFPEEGYWGRQTLTKPHCWIDPIKAPVEVRLQAPGAFGSRSGGGRRSPSEEHPLTRFRIWTPESTGASGQVECRLYIQGIFKAVWPSINTASFELPPILEHDVTVTMPHLESNAGTMAPILPRRDLLGQSHHGLRLIIEKPAGQGSIITRIEHDGASNSTATPWTTNSKSAPIWIMAIDSNGMLAWHHEPEMWAIESTEHNDHLFALGPEQTQSQPVTIPLPEMADGEYTLYAGYGPVSVVGSDGIQLPLNEQQPRHYFKGSLFTEPLSIQISNDHAGSGLNP